MTTDYEKFKEKHHRLLNQEELILEVTEELTRVRIKAGISKSELAKSLGVTKSRVTQIFNGDNLTIRTIADVADALGYRVTVSLHRR